MEILENGMDIDIVIKIAFILWGYVSGSILSGHVIPKYIFHKDTELESKDHNPGVANAFTYGGFWCGVMVLLFDLLKGAIPVMAGRQFMSDQSIWFAFLMAAPVAGHGFSCFHHGKGGKSIAVSFGTLIGLLPDARLLLLLAFIYILFSTVIRIYPHLYRSIAAFGSWAFFGCFIYPAAGVRLALLLISGIVIGKHWISRTDEKPELRMLWGK